MFFTETETERVCVCVRNHTGSGTIQMGEVEISPQKMCSESLCGVSQFLS
jgi:hypothetical protein